MYMPISVHGGSANPNRCRAEDAADIHRDGVGVASVGRGLNGTPPHRVTGLATRSCVGQ